MAEYRAIARGQGPDGRWYGEGEILSVEFTELVRNEQGEIERDKDGQPKTKKAKPPKWVEEISAKEAKAEKAEAETK